MSRKNSKVGLFEVATTSTNKQKTRLLRQKRRSSFTKPDKVAQPEVVNTTPADAIAKKQPKLKVIKRFELISFVLRHKKRILIGFAAVLVLVVCYRIILFKPAPIKTAQPQQAQIEQPVTDSAKSTYVNLDDQIPFDTPVGDTVILVASVRTSVGSKCFEPVIEHFKANAIELEVKESLRSFLLVTKKRYFNPTNAGSNGEKALNKILKVGLNYKTPKGYANFGKRPFQDAYGIKAVD